MPRFEAFKDDLQFKGQTFEEMLRPYKIAKEEYDKNLAENDLLAEGIAEYDKYLNKDTKEANALSQQTKDLIRKGADYIGTDFYMNNRSPLLRAKRTYQTNSSILKGGAEKMKEFLAHEQKKKDADSTYKSAYYDADGNLVMSPNIDNFLRDANLDSYGLSGEEMRKMGEKSASAMSARVAEAIADADWGMQFDPKTGIPVFVNWKTNETVSGVNVAATLAMIQGLDEQGKNKAIAEHPELKGFFDNPDLVGELRGLQQNENYQKLRGVDQQYMDNKFWEGVLQGLGPYKTTADKTVTGDPHWTQYDEDAKAARAAAMELNMTEDPIFEYNYSIRGDKDHWDKYDKDFARIGMHQADENDIDSVSLYRNVAIGPGFDRSGRQIWDDKGGKNDDLSATKGRDEVVNNPLAIAGGVKNYVTFYDKDNGDRLYSREDFIKHNKDNMMTVLDEKYQKQMSEGRYEQYFGKESGAYDRWKLPSTARSYNMDKASDKAAADIFAEDALGEMYDKMMKNYKHVFGGEVPEGATMKTIEDRMKKNMYDAGAASYKMTALRVNTDNKKQLGDDLMSRYSFGDKIKVKAIVAAERDKTKNGVNFKTEEYELDENDIKALNSGNIINVSLAPNPDQGLVVEWMNGTAKKSVLFEKNKLPNNYKGTKDKPGIIDRIKKRNEIDKEQKGIIAKRDAIIQKAQSEQLTDEDKELVSIYSQAIDEYEEARKKTNQEIVHLMTIVVGGGTKAEKGTATLYPNE